MYFLQQRLCSTLLQIYQISNGASHDSFFLFASHLLGYQLTLELACSGLRYLSREPYLTALVGAIEQVAKPTRQNDLPF